MRVLSSYLMCFCLFSKQVGWDESSVGERKNRVSIWDIELVATPFFICPPPFSRTKHPQFPGMLDKIYPSTLINIELSRQKIWGILVPFIKSLSYGPFVTDVICCIFKNCCSVFCSLFPSMYLLVSNWIWYHSDLFAISMPYELVCIVYIVFEKTWKFSICCFFDSFRFCSFR